MAEYVAADRHEGPERQDRHSGFLDLLLHQLHAHPAGSQVSGRKVSEADRRHRCAFGKI